MSNVLDLGHGHIMRFAVDSRSEQRFFIDEHPQANGPGQCAGSGRLLAPGRARPDDGKAYWTIESEEPLTLSPSLLCTACGDHGWVRGGVWVPV